MQGSKKAAAIVLAAGKGTRMGSDIKKQYLRLGEKPLIYYALKAFEDSPVDQIILVAGEDEIDYCRSEIVDKFGFQKVTEIKRGGKERHHSVFEGLKAASGCELVLIHDGARPCVTGKIIAAAMDGAARYDACVIGMPVKDTIKVSDGWEFAVATPDRRRLWQIQTPQAFEYNLIFSAYQKFFSTQENQLGVTDDAMVVERMTDRKVKLIRGSYDNIKVTAPEDLALAEALIIKRQLASAERRSHPAFDWKIIRDQKKKKNIDRF